MADKAKTRHQKKRPGPGRPPTRTPPRKYKRQDYSNQHFESTDERSVYERFMRKYIPTGPITVDYIERAVQWIGKQPNVSLHPILIKGFQSARLCAMVSWLVWVEAHCTSLNVNSSGWGEWFCAKYSDCEELTGISRLKIHALVKELRALGIISTKLVGVPAMQHFRLDHSALYTIIMESALASSDPIPDALDASEWTRGVNHD